MKTYNLKYIGNTITILIASLFVSCDGFHQEIIPVNVLVDDVPSVLVINGEIEKDSNVWVQISYSEDINAVAGTQINYEKNASVTLSTSVGSSENLNYWRNGIYYGTIIKGQVDKTYTLSIDIDGKKYSAVSTMFPGPGFQDAWVASQGKDGKTGSYGGYEEEWIVNDPSNERNRYLFQWYTNGNRDIGRDWAIDDNRVVNYNEGLRLINPTRGINANEYTVFRAAEIDKLTYDYYNMYEKIVRGIIGGDSQTPFNPVSNFGEGTMGNFRAVEFSSIAILTPPNLNGQGQNGQNVITFPFNPYFKKYNLYWSTTKGVTKDSDVLMDIKYQKTGGSKDDKGSSGKGEKNQSAEEYTGIFIHPELENGQTYYYRIEVEDSEGTVSVLSPEISLTPDPIVPADDNPDIEPKEKTPTNVKAITGNSSGEIIITWDDAQGAQQYGIYYSTSSGISGTSKESSIWGGKNGATVKSPYTLTGLKKGSTYYFRVASYDGSKTHLSEEVSAVAK